MRLQTWVNTGSGRKIEFFPILEQSDKVHTSKTGLSRSVVTLIVFQAFFFSTGYAYISDVKSGNDVSCFVQLS